MDAKIFLSPSKYVQGKGILTRSAELFVGPLGNRFMIVADERSYECGGKALHQTLEAAGATVTFVKFGGQSSLAEIDRITAIGKELQVDTVIAVGGGKSADTAKGVKERLKAALAVVPTIASTDAPTASLYAIYSEDDEVLEYRYTKNADLVLVDPGVICGAPAKFIAAGIADALATGMEMRACAQSDSCTTTGGRSTLAARAIAEKCEEVILKYGVLAYEANKAHVVTDAFEKVVEANTLLSGIGYESGGLAAAHSIHNGLTALKGSFETSHGEKVAYGILVQMFLEGRGLDEINKIVAFLNRLDLPTTLEKLGLKDATREDLMKVGRAATSKGETIYNMPFTIAAEDVADAIIAVDAYVKSI